MAVVRSNRMMGMEGPYASAAVTPYRGQNLYLQSVFDPWKCSSPIPDTNLAPAIPKSTNVADTIVMTGSNNMMLVIPWKTPYLQWRLYGFDPGLARYSLLRTIVPTEDLLQNFYRTRHVSGGLKIQSATVNGGAFQISGTMSGITYQNIPDLQTLTYANLTQFHENDTSFVANIPIFNGIAALAQPYQDYDFVIPESIINVCEEDVLSVSYNNASGSPTLSAFTIGNIVANGTLFSSDLAPGVLPGTQWGHHEINLRMQLLAVTAAPMSIVIEVQYASADPVTLLRVLSLRTYTQALQNVAIGEVCTATMEIRAFDDREITRIRVLNGVGAATVTIVPSLANEFARTELRYYNYSFNRLGASGPGTIIAWQGTTTGQQVALSMINHYEAVPNANLSKNVSSRMSKLQDPMDLEVAEFLLAHAPEAGIRFIYPLSEYVDMSVGGQFLTLSDREDSVARAGSFIDFARQAWTKVFKPIIKGAAPIIGSTLGGLFGPQGSSVGGMIGTGISNAIADSRSSYAETEMYPRPTNGPVSYSSTETLESRALNAARTRVPNGGRSVLTPTPLEGQFWYQGFLTSPGNNQYLLTMNKDGVLASTSMVEVGFGPACAKFNKFLKSHPDFEETIRDMLLGERLESWDIFKRLEREFDDFSNAYRTSFDIPVHTTKEGVTHLKGKGCNLLVNMDNDDVVMLSFADLVDRLDYHNSIMSICELSPDDYIEEHREFLEGCRVTFLEGDIYLLPEVWQGRVFWDGDPENLYESIADFLGQPNNVFSVWHEELSAYWRMKHSQTNKRKVSEIEVKFPSISGTYRDPDDDRISYASTLTEEDLDLDPPVIPVGKEEEEAPPKKGVPTDRHAYTGEGTLGSPKVMLNPVKHWPDVGLPLKPGSNEQAVQHFKLSLTSGAISTDPEDIRRKVDSLKITQNDPSVGKGTSFTLNIQSFCTDCPFPSVVEGENKKPEHLLQTMIIGTVPVAKLDVKTGSATQIPKFIVRVTEGIEYNIDTDLWVDGNWTPSTWNPFGKDGNISPWVSLIQGGIIKRVYVQTSHRIPVVGMSWHAAFVAALFMLPVGCALTGSQDASTVSLAHKAGTCIAAGLRLGIVGAKVEALGPLNDAVQKAGFLVLDGLPYVASPKRPMVFLLRSYKESCILTTMMALSASALKSVGPQQASVGVERKRIQTGPGQYEVEVMSYDIKKQFPTRSDWLKWIDENLDILDDLYDSKSKDDPEAYFDKIVAKLQSYYIPTNMLYDNIRKVISNVEARKRTYVVPASGITAKNRRKKERLKANRAQLQPQRGPTSGTAKSRLGALFSQVKGDDE